MRDCVFCDILSGQLPASFVYEDAVCCAFMDIQPVNPGHVLVIPREHVASLDRLAPQTGERVFAVAQQIAVTLRAQVSGIRCEGINLFLADGQVAGQDVFHVHLHVIPRFRGDGFGFRFGPSYGARPSRATLDSVAQGIREANRE